jgi:hypothetical protein
LERVLITFALLAACGAVNAELSWSELSTVTGTEAFNDSGATFDYSTCVAPSIGRPYGGAVGTIVSLGTLKPDTPVNINLAYLGQESGYNDAVHLTINGSNLFESNPVGTSLSATVSSPGAIGSNFENYAFVLGYNDSAGTRYPVDWDDMVIGANSAAAVPEPKVYAMMLAGLWLMGFVARRRHYGSTA